MVNKIKARKCVRMSEHRCVSRYVSICMNACKHVNIHVGIYVHVNVYEYTYVQAYECVHMHTCWHVHV